MDAEIVVHIELATNPCMSCAPQFTSLAFTAWICPSRQPADVARAAGVSIATVDRVLHGRSGVRAHRRAGQCRHRPARLPARPAAAQRLAQPQRAHRLRAALGTNSFITCSASSCRRSRPGSPSSARWRACRRWTCSRPRPWRSNVALQAVATRRRDGAGPPAGARRDRRSGGARHRGRHAGVRRASSRRAATSSASTTSPPAAPPPRCSGASSARVRGAWASSWAAARCEIMCRAPVRFRAGDGRRASAPGAAASIEGHDLSDRTEPLVAELLAREPALLGLYSIGAGNRGIAGALEASGLRPRGHLRHDSPYARRALLDSTADAVINQDAGHEVPRPAAWRSPACTASACSPTRSASASTSSEGQPAVITIGIDIGTSGVKAALVRDGDQCWRTVANLTVSRPQPGFSEQHPSTGGWPPAPRSTSSGRRRLRRWPTPRPSACRGQMHGATLLDARRGAAPLHPLERRPQRPRMRRARAPLARRCAGSPATSPCRLHPHPSCAGCASTSRRSSRASPGAAAQGLSCAGA